MTQQKIALKVCPDGNPNHALVEIDAETAAALGYRAGSLLHIDRRRTPANGDVVVAELQVGERLARTVRQFTRVDGVISLARIAGPPGSLIRPRHEVGILGVADGHIAPLRTP